MLTEHQKGPRPVVYKINLRFRRFSSRTGHLTGLIVYYIAPRPQDARRGSSVSRAHDLARFGSKPGPAAISPCTITMDRNAIIFFMTDGLTRAPDADVHAPSVGSTKVPFSACRCRILVVDYRWGSIGSDETAITTTGGPRVIDVFDGNGAPSGPNYLLFSDVDRLSASLWDRSEVGWSPRPHVPILGAPQRALDPKLGDLGSGPTTG